MDDFSEKLSQLLSDPESLEKIKNLAGSFMPDSGKAQEKSEPQKPHNNSENSASGNGFGIPSLDPQILFKISNIISKANTDNDEKLKLLNSIKPYLSDKRAEKIDSAVQILKMSKYASVLVKDLDLFKK